MRLILLFMLLTLDLFSQVRPDYFPEELNPTNENFEVYSQKNGNVRRASLENLKKYFTSEVTLTPVNYIPANSGNTQNLMSYVTDPNGDVWYIDGGGHAVKLRGDSKVSATLTINEFNSTQVVIPADATEVKVYVGGLLQTEAQDYNRNGSFINFAWTPPLLKLVITYKY